MKLNGVQMGAENPKELAVFYTKVFGEPKWAMPGDWYGWDVGSGHIFFGPHSEVKGIATEPQRIMLAFETEDVRNTYDKLIAAGATSVAEPYHPDDDQTFWQATVADPEGNYLQLASPWE